MATQPAPPRKGEVISCSAIRALRCWGLAGAMAAIVSLTSQQVPWINAQCPREALSPAGGVYFSAVRTSSAVEVSPNHFWSTSSARLWASSLSAWQASETTIVLY
jgi:hypothetical protein